MAKTVHRYTAHQFAIVADTDKRFLAAVSCFIGNALPARMPIGSLTAGLREQFKNAPVGGNPPP